MPLRFSTLYRKTKPPVEISLILGVGGADKKWKGNFWVLPRASLSSAAEAQVSFVKILRILSEIHSNFVQYTPPKLKIGIGSRNGVVPQARHKRIPAKNSRIQKGFPRSAWLVVCQYNSMNNQTKKFFIYTRKSTDYKDRQVRSISDQLSELKELALKEQLEVVDVFVEKQTAKIPGRPVFNEMMGLLPNGKIVVFATQK